MIGTCVRVIFACTDLTGSNDRPALVLSNPDARGDLDLLMITSKEPSSDCIRIRSEDYATGCLPRQACVRLSRPLRIHCSKVVPLPISFTREFTASVRKQLIKNDTREYSKLAHHHNRPGDDSARPTFQPGQTIPYGGRVFTEDEVEAAVSATLDFWLTLGPEGKAFESEFSAFMGVKRTLLVNSGSSANLVALSALTSHKLPPHKRIRPGAEVITVAAGFPTTVTPIIQVGAVPVFIDSIALTANADCSQLEAAYAPGKTMAVMMAHALGNPFELVTVLEFCKKYDLWLIEDNCDALGCTYTMPLAKAKELGLDHLLKIAEKGMHPIIRIHHLADAAASDDDPSPELYLTAPTGSFGDISTQSFYPPHHLTMGEGGAVNIIHKAALMSYAESFRDWGRDCWCPSGLDNSCHRRFNWQLGELPVGYDHKYIYSHLGYNLKPLDPQAAIGRVQLRRLPAFVTARKQNWEKLRRGLHGLDAYFDFALPAHAIAWRPPFEEKAENLKTEMLKNDADLRPTTFRPSDSSLDSSFSWDDSRCRSDCSWFGFKLTVRPQAPFTRTELAQHLDAHQIGNRMLFGGNLVRQPAFVQLKRDNPEAFRVAAPLTGSDHMMNHTIFLGTYPGLTAEQIDYMVQVIRDFAADKAASCQCRNV